ncbi:hypothetical protein DLM77_07110 [Leptospira yasudae]|uniref:Uncharacterized protein n=1 Tax=Leptospira yasudae TaxID=2202201 RepID=A0ABX9M4L9_9LEPT|nr:hypothetical protein DLM77_07110 [Leptospira yasudae]
MKTHGFEMDQGFLLLKSLATYDRRISPKTLRPYLSSNFSIHSRKRRRFLLNVRKSSPFREAHSNFSFKTPFHLDFVKRTHSNSFSRVRKSVKNSNEIQFDWNHSIRTGDHL